MQHDGVSTVHVYLDSVKHTMKKILTGSSWNRDMSPIGDVKYDTTINGGVNTSSTYYCKDGCRLGKHRVDRGLLRVVSFPGTER